jgi:hypothetical protein
MRSNDYLPCGGIPILGSSQVDNLSCKSGVERTIRSATKLFVSPAGFSFDFLN